MRKSQKTNRGPGQKGSHILGDLIRRSRESRGMSMADLAVEADVSESMIGKIERGVRPVTHPETISLIADSLRINEDEFYRLQKIAPPDILDLLYECVGLNPSRLRWALGKVVNGELFDEEIAKAGISGKDFPGEVLVPRKRTVAEERAWEKLQDKAQRVS